MSWIIPSVIAQLSCVIVLALVYLYLFRQERERFIGIWAFSWLACSVRFVFDLWMLFGQESAPLMIGNQIFSFLSGVLLFGGTAAFLGKAIPKWWVYGAALGVIWIVVSILTRLPFYILTIPTFTFLGMIYVWTGIAFLRSRQIDGAGKPITGWAFILWGIHKVNYPVLRPLPWFAPWGYLIAAVLSLVVAIGILLVYFQKTRNDLSKSEERFRLLAENAQDLIYRYRLVPSPGFEYVSPAAAAITGYTPEEHYADPDFWCKLAHPDDRGLLKDVLLRPSASSADPLILRWIHKNGKVIWIEQRNVPIHDEAGNFVAIEGIARDATFCKKAEELLKRYQLLSEHTRDIILFIRRDGHIIEANNAAAAAYGYERKELLSLRIHDLREPGADCLIASQMEQAGSKGILFETLHRRKDGSFFPVEVNSVGAIIGGEQVLLSIVRDITDRKRAARSESHRAALAATVPDTIVLVDGGGRLIWLNEAGRAFFGGNAIGKPVSHFIMEKEKAEPFENLCRLFTRPVQPLLLETALRRQDGSVRLLSWHCLPVTGAGGEDEVLCIARDVTDERRAAEETMRQKEWLRVILQSIGDGVLAVDLERRITLMNPVAEALTGWPAEEALARDMGEVFRIFNEKTGMPAVNPLDRVLAEGVVVGLANHTALVARDGTERPIADSGAPIRDSEGRLLGAVMIFRDATEQRTYENELSVSREHYRALYEAIGGGVVVQKNGRIEEVNAFAEEILGLSRREIVGRTIPRPDREARREDRIPSLKEEFLGMKALQSGKAQRDVVMSMCHNATGRSIWLQVNSVPLFDREGRVEGVVTTFMDITASKEAEAELARRKEFVEQILQTAGVVILLLDPEGTIISLNSFGEHILGYREEEVRGKSWLEIFIPETERGKIRKKFLRILGVGSYVSENFVLARDGHKVLVRWHSSLLHDPAGRVTAILEVGHDVTELRAIEAQLRQAQKMEAIGQLAGGIAHDFNNLLTGILGNISLALSDVPADSSYVTMLEEAERAAKRAAEITSQLLGFSRKAIMQPRPVNINECISETVGILRRTIDPRIKVETCLEKDLWVVQVDLAQITQVLMNLCLNAQDAMPEGGAIILETGNVTLVEEHVLTHPIHGRAGDFVILSISDTGCGMPPEVRERIFEPFFTTKAIGRGTGLGLAMVYGIVRQHEGWVECYSEAGMGTRFTVYLPRFSGGTPGGVTPKSNPEESPYGSETVLVVDDEEMVRNLAQKILGRYGYNVLMAEDGLAALDIYRRKKEEIDLILLDMTMPRLSGRDTMHALKEIDKGVTVLLSSGYSLNGLGEDLLGAGAAGFVQKPYRAAELARAVRQALDLKTGP